MLGLLGVLTIGLLLFLIISKKTSAVVALILVPVLAGIIAGKFQELPSMISSGLVSIAPTGVMFVFAILFFGVLMDAGTFQPIISRLLKLAGNDPVKIALATAILAMMVHLDGSGAVTFLVVIPALLHIYDAIGMNRLTLASIVALSAGTMNVLPWGGPTIRAASALDISVTELFNPLLIPFLVGLATVFGIAFYLGKRERNTIPFVELSKNLEGKIEPAIKLPLWRFWVNIALILFAILTIVMAWAPPYVVFMIAFGLALLINFPKVSDQKERVDAHAKEALLMASILFAAGCFTGILKGSGMMDAMASGIQTVLPEFLGRQLPLLTGILAMPSSLVFDPDSFYFGILPLLASTAETFQVSGIEVGQAAILGQMTTGFPVSPLTGSTYLLIGLAGVDLGDHQKKTIPLAFLVTLVMLFVSVLIGVISV
ncbi:CitMHS family transporter [Algoriphagus zhangzhouensis]|uniref:Citrate-Mg2+:H+ or citrate-Ca2+:H+ symporter, CitMHS family n=1 Tax=Algoriphagus zhangzhouensis TaxID=1073327 RepID=A0A1M7ZKN2_9BACT|nr:citrate:proton symporter [Algoriphagus zhangzhouensis]TDY43120.1 CitMHS family citrate-Mg2+:H+ or citrate-Ca2+:H+ symporter [Algoriphagus zhangzhouensis]SHO65236.1 citrate-Mg2+:H+ or citrate-Ca2+:H+ symporter, CitMHS family [Algoriphagus zhangzhouensis]